MLPFCQPETLETVAENLGEVLRGDKIMNSNYELKMGVEETCKILCKKELTASEAKEFATRCAAAVPPLLQLLLPLLPLPRTVAAATAAAALW